MTDIADWLSRYPCGPGNHIFSPTGISMTPIAQAVQPSRPLANADEVLQNYDSCGKSSWEETPTCEICEWSPATVAPTRVLVMADGTRKPELRLCDSCHVAIIAGSGGGIAIEWAISS